MTDIAGHARRMEFEYTGHSTLAYFGAHMCTPPA